LPFLRLSRSLLPDKVSRVRSSRRRRRHTHKLLALAIVVAALAAIGGGSTLAYAAVKSGAEQLQAQLTTELQGGQIELEAGKTSLELANKGHDTYWATRAVEHFAAAKGKFLAAGSLADNSQLLKRLELLPSAGGMARSRHDAVRGISAMGVAVSQAGEDLAALDAELIKPSVAGTAGRTLLTVLDQTHTGLIQVRADFDRAQKAASQVDTRVVPSGQLGTFLKARDTIGAALAGLDEFERLFPVLKDVLGGNGARTYLIEQVNPAELRPGGGFIGTFSVIRADQGSLSLIRSGNSYELADPRPSPSQPGFIPLPDPMRDLIPQVSWSFVDSNLYPDFPSNATTALRFAQPRLGKIDAVISIDYYAVAKMLEITGPLAVPGYGRTVDGANFIGVVMGLELANSPVHKAILSVIAGPLMERISALPADRWPVLISELNGLAAARHIQAYFTNELVEMELIRVGWSGSFNPTASSDYMMAVESNIGGGKVNYFLSRHYTVTLTRIGNMLRHNVAVDLVNNQPYRYDMPTDYSAYGSLYAGENVSARSNNLRPARYGKLPPPAGAVMLEGWLPDVQCCGSRGQAVFEYETMWLTGATGHHDIYWQKQPGTVSDAVDVIWSDGFGHIFKTSGDLGQDRVITLTATGVTLTPGRPAQAALPSLSLG